jgi:hypothetical protein
LGGCAPRTTGACSQQSPAGTGGARTSTAARGSREPGSRGAGLGSRGAGRRRRAAAARTLRADGELRVLEEIDGRHVGELAHLVLRQELERVVHLDVQRLHRLLHLRLRALGPIHEPLLLVVDIEVDAHGHVAARGVAVDDLGLDVALGDLLAVLVERLALAMHARRDLVATPGDLQGTAEANAHGAHNARLAAAVGSDDAVQPRPRIDNFGVTVRHEIAARAAGGKYVRRGRELFFLAEERAGGLRRQRTGA